jgi:acetyl-CoA carboxylase carboxyl transferase subunit alpha
MMENSVYSVISPEGCASIMWRDASKKEIAAQALRITAPDLKEMAIIDEIIPEPDGGAHLDHDAAAALVDEVLFKHFNELKHQPVQQLLDGRYNKFRQMAQFRSLAALSISSWRCHRKFCRQHPYPLQSHAPY